MVSAFRSFWILALVFGCRSIFAFPAFQRLAGVPAELAAPRLTVSGVGRVLSARTEPVSFESLNFEPAWDNRWHASLPGSTTFAVEQMPQIPVLDRQISLPLGQTAKVTLVDLQVEQTSNKVALEMTPPLTFWDPFQRMSFPPPPAGKYFPGTFYRVADDGHTLNVHFFPLQYDRGSGQVLALRSAKMRVEFVETTVEYLAPSMWGSESVILTSEKLAGVAEKLADFQLERSGVHSEVITIESIDESEAMVNENELPDGYKQRDAANGSVVPYDPEKKTGYNYELARKIVNYFRKRMGEGTPLKYLTLLGDATIVPPSYYFSSRANLGFQFGVTDWCYAARKQCSEPRFAIGRLPFQSTEEVENYLAKVQRWISQAENPASEVSLFGGKGLQSELFVGELGVLGILNSQKTNWFGAKKFFRTKQNFNKKTVLSMIRGGNDSSFVYYLDHGLGNQWYVETDYVTSNDILAASPVGTQLNPAIVSISCSAAAFDETLFKDIVFARARFGSVSIGVALMKSQAGAIAFWGAARPSVGTPIYSIDASGNVNLTGGNYMLQIMSNFFEKYQDEKGGTLGGLQLQAVKQYLYEQGNDMTDPINRWTYLNMALLGDPVLRLPVRRKFEKAYPIAKSTGVFTGMGPAGFPDILFKAVQNFPLSFEGTTPLSASLLKIGQLPLAHDQVLAEQSVANGKGSFQVKIGEEAGVTSRYFVRLENSEGVPLERQVWFETRPQPGGTH